MLAALFRGRLADVVAMGGFAVVGQAVAEMTVSP